MGLSLETDHTHEQLQAVYTFLETYWDEWKVAKEIQQATGIDPAQLRCMANKTGMFISSVYGYKLTDYASKDEINDYFENLESRIQGIKNHIKTLSEYINE